MCVCVRECVREREREEKREAERGFGCVSLFGEWCVGVFVWMCIWGFVNLWSSKGKTESEKQDELALPCQSLQSFSGSDLQPFCSVSAST